MQLFAFSEVFSIKMNIIAHKLDIHQKYVKKTASHYCPEYLFTNFTIS